jgi:DNA-binding PadR family transcriptional regulator
MNKKHLGELEQMVLLAILQLGEGAYGTAILEELEIRGDRKVSPGALFATLDRLEGKRLVRSRMGDPTPGRGGRPKRFMTVTQEGLEAIRQARTAWMNMAEGLGDLVQ